MVNEISNFGQGLYPPTCIYSLSRTLGNSLDATLNTHISCYITDTDGRFKPMNLGHLWICLVGITPSNNPGTEREILPYMVRDSPYAALYGHWATPLVMEYNSRAREYCVFIPIKCLTKSDSLSDQQICLNNLHCHCKSMELRVGHFQTTTMKTLKLVIVFEQYKKI